MLPTSRAEPSLVVAAAAVMLAVSTPAWAGIAGQMTDGSVILGQLLGLARDGAEQIRTWIVAGYARRPALMIGLAGVLLLPPLMAVGWMIYRNNAPTAPRDADPAQVWPLMEHPRLELDGTGAIALPAGRDLVQIGRQDDNDICIEDETVHRYHAVIERTGDGFAIVDVSGPDGNGLVVNGQRRTTAVLAHGDTLELGRARMRFATAA
jgi:hypothetical protein